MTDAFEQLIDSSVEFVQNRWNKRPRFGIVLGTGAGEVAKSIDTESVVGYEEIPNFPRSTAVGHEGQFVCGQLAGENIIAMKGRFHLYGGWSVEQATLPIHMMQRLGVEILFVSNAAGGICPKFVSGEIMLIESHIDFMFRSTPHMFVASPQSRPLTRSDAYDRELIQLAQSCARREGFSIQQGVYASMLGPNYETRAEYRFLRRIGADVVGMSTVPEVAVAGRYGMRVLGMSIVSNIAKPDVLEATSGQEVIDAAAVAAPHLKQIVIDIITKS